MNPGWPAPRDGDPRAAFLLLDLGEQVARFRRVDYDVEQTQEEIRAVDLSERSCRTASARHLELRPRLSARRRR